MSADTPTQTGREFGVRYRRSDGTTFEACGFTEKGARFMWLREAAAVAVVCRSVGPWVDAPKETK